MKSGCREDDRRNKKISKFAKMPRRKINFEEDEYLTLEVKKFKCLYDKQCSAYKDKRAKCNAWSLVDTSLGIEEGNYYILNAYSGAWVLQLWLRRCMRLLLLFAFTMIIAHNLSTFCLVCVYYDHL